MTQAENMVVAQGGNMVVAQGGEHGCDTRREHGWGARREHSCSMVAPLWNGSKLHPFLLPVIAMLI